jgi:predicted nucleic acid-binding protein
MIITDPSICSYYLDENATEHQYVIEPLEKEVERGGVAVNNVIVMEVARFLIGNLGPMEGMEKVTSFLGVPTIIDDLDYGLTTKSIRLLAKYSHMGIGGRDATILATAKNLGVNRIMTHDQAFKKVDWVEVVDPIETDRSNP